MQAYAFTLKLNCKASDRERATKTFYQDILKGWSDRGTIRAQVFEYDNSRRLHSHGIIELPKDFRYSTLKPEGCHTRFVPIHDLCGWKRYMMKDQNLMRYALSRYPEHDVHELSESSDSDDTRHVISRLKTKLFSKAIVHATEEQETIRDRVQETRNEEEG